MNFKIVKLLVLSALFFAILSATPMFMTSTHANMKTDNLTSKPATEVHPNAHLTGDPVGGGVPKVQTMLIGDPVGGGVPKVQTMLIGDPVGGGVPLVHTMAD
ncbi:MAG: hypothetical protein ABSG57_11750 [Candidatus Bathyarchaeia archaeon]